LRYFIIIVGGIISALTVALVSSGLWLMDNHKKHLNRLRTEKGRQTKLDNLAKDKANNKANNNGIHEEEAGTEEAGTEEAGTEEAGTEEAGTEEAGTEEAGTEEK